MDQYVATDTFHWEHSLEFSCIAEGVLLQAIELGKIWISVNGGGSHFGLATKGQCVGNDDTKKE